MFPDFPNLFGKSFAIGFFLPGALLVVALLRLGDAFGIVVLEEWPDAGDLLGAAAVLFAMWLVAILLMAVNRPLVRALEGYPLLELAEEEARESPDIAAVPGSGETRVVGGLVREYRRGRHAVRALVRPFAAGCLQRERDRFDREAGPLFDLARRIDEARTVGDEEPLIPPDFSERLREAVAAHPHAREWVLPTRLGNIMRAYEVYSHVVYGLDAIPAWPRLAMVLPERARTRIQEARAPMDFALNLLAGSMLVVVAYVLCALATLSLPVFWMPLLAAVLAWASWFLLHASARQWGEQVKSAFDLHRHVLARSLDLELPPTLAAERRMWMAVSRMMIYRTAAGAAALDEFRRKRDPAATGVPEGDART